MSKTILTKSCPHCKATIDKTAKKCQHCQTDLRNWINRHPIWTVIILIFLIPFFISAMNDTEKTNISTNTQNNNLQVGQEAYLRLPNISDPSQMICLGETINDANKITKAMLAKDFIGLLEIKGAFCVSNGTKVKIIEKDFPLRKVRIVQGVNKVDNDKIGLAGWLPLEWVVTE
ncbi:MAG: zinc ribbon domain-containing protein [Lutibacter sp.]|nr:zinc ribbon domain-containing protein [Lutibacter sp.]